MAETALRGTAVQTNGDLPALGSSAPAFTLTTVDLQSLASSDLAGKTVVLNIFPSIDTGVCAQSVRTFNERAAGLQDATVVCVSADLPFALSRFCGAENIENVTAASAFRGSFLADYGVRMVDGPLADLAARSVVVIDGAGTVVHTELVDDITHEPDYNAALAAIG